MIHTPIETPAYYGHQLLLAENDLRCYRNNAGAFSLRAELAATDDARQDALGSRQYWLNLAHCQEARVRHLTHLRQASEQP